MSNSSRLIFMKSGLCNTTKYLLVDKLIKVSQRFKMNGPNVEIKYGKLRGTIRDNIDGGQYISFRGIPFAEPPVGKLRFKEPQPLEPWSGTRDALNESKISAQMDLYTKQTEGGDDCLYLDVATNSLTGTRPVMVWIHGGAFSQSSNTYKKYSPDYLLKKDIVFVAINYRLGVLGFLNMEHEECAGNQGLKDQLLALKWVRENIKVFGGDPENVTIFGGSAGAASVNALCLSPKGKGLFHKAIMQSGVLFNTWANITSNKDTGYYLAKTLGKECTSALEVIEFLRSIPAISLIKAYKDIYMEEELKLNFRQVPTTDESNINPFFPEPIKQMKKSKIELPIIIGYNSHEGILLFLLGGLNSIKHINDNFEEIINNYLRINNKEKLSKISKIVREFYFGNDEITEQNHDEIVQLFGDLLFVNGIVELADIQLQNNSQIYLYKFSYQPDYPGIKERLNVKMKGTCHGDEAGCIFFSEKRLKKLLVGTRDRKTMERVTTMWTNFAKFGDPTPCIDKLITTRWLPLEKYKKYYLEIDDNLTCGESSDDKKWKMWKSILQSL